MAFGDFFLVSICCLYTPWTWRCSAWVSHQQKHTSTRARFDTVHSPLSSIKRWTYASTKQHQDLTSIPLSRYCPNQELLDFSGNRWMQNAIDVVRLNANIYFYWILFRQLFCQKKTKFYWNIYSLSKKCQRERKKKVFESHFLWRHFFFSKVWPLLDKLFLTHPPPAQSSSCPERLPRMTSATQLSLEKGLNDG